MKMQKYRIKTISERIKLILNKKTIIFLNLADLDCFEYLLECKMTEWFKKYTNKE